MDYNYTCTSKTKDENAFSGMINMGDNMVVCWDSCVKSAQTTVTGASSRTGAIKQCRDQVRNQLSILTNTKVAFMKEL